MRVSFGFIGADTARSRAYFDALRRRALLPSVAIVTAAKGASGAFAAGTTPLFDNVTSLLGAFERASVRTIATGCTTNEPPAVAAVRVSTVELFVFSGGPGEILQPAMLDTGKMFLHVHPGRLPNYRGSTPMYYSLLLEGRLDATALLLDRGIDTGAVVAERRFPLPRDPATIDAVYDPWMRAQLLADVVEKYVKAGSVESIPQKGAIGTTFYVIHPVLKHLAVVERKT